MNLRIQQPAVNVLTMLALLIVRAVPRNRRVPVSGPMKIAAVIVLRAMAVYRRP